MHYFTKIPKVTLLIITIILLVSAGALVVFGSNTTPQPTPTVSPSTEETSITGTLECLPPKYPDRPHTLECAYGLKTSEANYYALDTTLFPSPIIYDLAVGTELTVIGMVVPASELADQLTERYNIIGSILVQDIERQ